MAPLLMTNLNRQLSEFGPVTSHSNLPYRRAAVLLSVFRMSSKVFPPSLDRKTTMSLYFTVPGPTCVTIP